MSLYHTIYPIKKMSEGDESLLDSQPFDIRLENPYHKMDDITGIIESNYHRTQDIIGGVFHNTFNRLN
jgi:hypothetical protein